ncbi:hypothetical protein EVAR_84883_1 [Eumeta japonica]|uniref:Uncharacterized protein n=1 Tax=Eumeta variegata TaxID=151549 RepID=A0A4C1YIS6_EUMVA|nr:hypothetical protein EVAR_84883_1 [Eumeta japonica]
MYGELEFRWPTPPPSPHSLAPSAPLLSIGPLLPPSDIPFLLERKAMNQKVVVSCSSAEDAKKNLEEVQDADFKDSEPEKNLPTVVTRDVLAVNADENIVRSLRTLNRHITDGLDWEKERKKVCYRRRACNEATRCLRSLSSYIDDLSRPAMYTWGSNCSRSGTSPPSCSARAAWASYRANNIVKMCSTSVPIARGPRWRKVPIPERRRAPKMH